MKYWFQWILTWSRFHLSVAKERASSIFNSLDPSFQSQTLQNIIVQAFVLWLFERLNRQGCFLIIVVKRAERSKLMFLTSVYIRWSFWHSSRCLDNQSSKNSRSQSWWCTESVCGNHFFFDFRLKRIIQKTLFYKLQI